MHREGPVGLSPDGADLSSTPTLEPGTHHILGDGSLESNAAAEQRLVEKFGLQPTLFDGPAEIVEQAYERQERRIAHRQEADPRRERHLEDDEGA